MNTCQLERATNNRFAIIVKIYCSWSMTAHNCDTYKKFKHLLVRLHGPVGFDGWVTEVTDFIEHGSHESGAKSLSVGQNSLTLLISCILPTTSVVVECWKVIQKLTSPLHVPRDIQTNCTVNYTCGYAVHNVGKA